MSEAVQHMFVETGRMTMGTPKGHLRVTAEEAKRRGLALDDVAAWCETRGGRVDRDEYRSKSLGPSNGKTTVRITFVVPESEIRKARA